MEIQALVATRSSALLPQSLASVPSSLGRQWSFRVERRKLTLLSSRRKYMVDVRAKKSGAGAGSSKVKSKEAEAEEDEEQAAPGTKKLFTLPGTQKLPSKGGNRSKDNNTVFVAGATGKVGRRTVKELVRLGYNVRAGVRNPDNAQFLLEQEEEKEEPDDEEAEEQPKKKNFFASFSVEKLFGFLGPKGKRGAGTVELVQCDLEKSVDDIEEALGNASVVICSIGASEKEVLDVSGPYRIDYKATKSLIDAASSANVNHFILVTSLGTQKFGWPAAVLNLFWGVLYWKAKAEKALLESGIPFTIVRPGGMERPTDAYKETHNLRLAEADTLFGGQVSNLQVAELMAAVVGNLDLARNKVLEVVAETTAPLRPFEDLLAEISSVDEETEPVKKRSEISKQTKQPSNRQQDEERAATLKRQAAEQQKTEALRQKLQQEYEAARFKEEEARQEAEAARAQKAEIERKTAELRSKLQAAEQSAREAKALETALIAAARQGKKLSEREKQDVIASSRREFEAEQKAAEAKQDALQVPKEKPKAEATAKAPVQSKAEVAAEKLAEQKPEKKAKQEAETKAAAEAELAAKAEAEAKAAAEAELAAMAEAEARAKADAEEAQKKSVEAEKAKEEEDKRTIEAERKAEEEKKRADSERRAREEKEEKEKMTIEAEKKAKEEEEKQAAAEVETEAKPKGFRWPWQKQESEEEAVPLGSSATEETATAEEPQRKELPRTSRPLSPYAQFPSLKPPTSPSYRPAPKVQADVAEAATPVPEELVLEEDGKTAAVAAEASPEKENKAESGGFRWPWQKPDPEEVPPQEQTPAEPIGEKTAPINQTTIQEEASTKGMEELPRPSRPLSPYTAFPALKPPTSPSPPRNDKPEGEAEAKAETPKESSATVVEVQAQEDIDARAEEEERLKALAAQEAEAAAERERLALEKANAASGIRWPWGKRETDTVEVQPEVTAVPSAESTVASPAEAASEVLQKTAAAGVLEVGNSAAAESAQTTSTTEPQKTRPLSPYIMYPGLKPPGPPSPPKSPGKQEPGAAALNEQPKSEASGNGSAPETVEEGEKVLEPAGAFRWPWQQ